jgi:hypothetical protein
VLRKITLLICAAILVCLLCSCAQKTPQQPTTTVTEAPASGNTTLPLEPTATEVQAPPAWKSAYLEFLEGKNGEYITFSLVFVDEDDIPELYLGGCSNAIGDRLCSYQNGTLKQMYIRRVQGGQYVPHSSLLINYNGTVGYYYTEVFQLTDGGFDCLWSGLEKHGSGHNGFNEYYGSASYYIDDVRVSKAEYEAAIREQIDMEQLVPFHENGVSYEDICQQIIGY